jgi:hypothetical protein
MRPPAIEFEGTPPEVRSNYECERCGGMVGAIGRDQDEAAARIERLVRGHARECGASGLRAHIAVVNALLGP